MSDYIELKVESGTDMDMELLKSETLMKYYNYNGINCTVVYDGVIITDRIYNKYYLYPHHK